MNTHKKLIKKFFNEYSEEKFNKKIIRECNDFNALKDNTDPLYNFDLQSICHLQKSNFIDFLRFDYQETAIYSLVKEGDSQKLIDCFNTLILNLKYYDKYNHVENIQHTIQEDYLFEFWCLAVFFEHSELEQYTRKTLKEDLVLGQTGYRNWQYPEHAIECVLPIVKNMIASVENNELTLKESGSDYDEFFNSSTVTKDALHKQDGLHLARTKGKKMEDGDYYHDPVTRLNHAVFPFQMLAWYKLAKKQNIELDVQGTIIEPFINIQYRKGIQDPDLLKLIDVLSETVGEDVLKLIE